MNNDLSSITEGDMLLPESNVRIRTGTIFDCNSAYVSKYDFNAYRTMTFEQFKKEIVPTLQESEATGEFFHYEIRDLSHSNYFVLMRDGVIQYKVAKATDLEYDKFYEEFKKLNDRSKNLKRYIINSTLPVYSYGEGDGLWEMAVKIPETKFRFHSPNYDGEHVIYMPPVVYSVTASNKFRYIRSSVKVITQDSIDYTRMKFGILPFPNVCPADSHICVGASYSDNIDTDTMTPTKFVAMSWDLFLGSNWNHDYLVNAFFPANLEEISKKYNANPEPDNKPEVVKFRTLLELLKKPGVYEELEWEPYGRSV